ncbi:DUF4271 domain-containing protein [Phaeodactylibacter sp.]|uniref:DUF4271 domain-containing protein n=1 Tax=Phaeodactylibacter sp. TaxID=1940289 RepID=UPI0025FFACE2|nr:DUF4271 domain-containing protein [Phaeodactylibacter sp.]MCI4649889.1 DUF4271 domain-containing protein [Phaeodactylibacter sp.]MCI5092305.1 DUF4271 domain-containing protein [Phaeodactylibacter sp.]
MDYSSQCATFVRTVKKLAHISTRFLLVSLLSVLIASGVWAQANPFDLTPRLSATEGADTLGSTTPVTGNPFDIVPSSPEAQPSDRVLPPPDAGFSSKPVVTIDSRFNRVVFITTVGSLLLLTVLITLFRAQLGRAYRAFLNDNLLNQLQREREGGGGLPYYLFYGLYMLSAGFFVFLLTEYFEIPVAETPWISLLMCVLGIIVFWIGKHLLLTYIRLVFPVEKEIRVYNMTIVVFNLILGIALIIGNGLFAYGPDSLKTPMLYLIFAVIAGVYLFMFLRSLFSAGRFLSFHKFHFLLYICTVEIAPVLILVKGLTTS